MANRTKPRRSRNTPTKKARRAASRAWRRALWRTFRTGMPESTGDGGWILMPLPDYEKQRQEFLDALRAPTPRPPGDATPIVKGEIGTWQGVRIHQSAGGA